jgi:hypothetical protein
MLCCAIHRGKLTPPSNTEIRSGLDQGYGGSSSAEGYASSRQAIVAAASRGRNAVRYVHMLVCMHIVDIMIFLNIAQLYSCDLPRYYNYMLCRAALMRRQAQQQQVGAIPE